MNNATEDLLTASMRQQVAGLMPAPDLVARAARRHRQRGRIRLAASILGTAGTAAVAIAVTTAQAGPGADRTIPNVGRAVGQQASSPRTRLLAAMTSSAQLSYRLHLVNEFVQPDVRLTPTSRPKTQVGVYADYTGVYDPKTRSGVGVDKAGVNTQVRIIDGRYYTRPPGDTWFTRPGTLVEALVLNGGGRTAWEPEDGAVTDSTALLAALRHLGSVTFAGLRGSGARALDTYAFSYGIAGDNSVMPHELTGTVVVYHGSGLIAKISMQTTVTGANPQLGDGGPLTFMTVMTFSDYGVPVSVQAPTGHVQHLKPLPMSVAIGPKQAATKFRAPK